MILRITAPASLSRAICPSVARVRALMGLKATLPRILTQISVRIFCVTGQRIPALMSAVEMALQRSDRDPSGSPRERRVALVWRGEPRAGSSGGQEPVSGGPQDDGASTAHWRPASA